MLGKAKDTTKRQWGHNLRGSLQTLKNPRPARNSTVRETCVESAEPPVEYRRVGKGVILPAVSPGVSGLVRLFGPRKKWNGTQATDRCFLLFDFPGLFHKITNPTTDIDTNLAT